MCWGKGKFQLNNAKKGSFAVEEVYKYGTNPVKSYLA